MIKIVADDAGSFPKDFITNGTIVPKKAATIKLIIIAIAKIKPIIGFLFKRVTTTKTNTPFLSDIEKTIKTKDLNKYQMYTDLDDKLISSILNLDNIKKVENIYQYLNQGIVVTSWENTDYSKAQIVHVFDDNGNRLTLSRQPTLYCPNSCSSKLLSDISNL